MIAIIVFALAAIPVVALIDYFVFRKRFSEEMGYPMKWHYFVAPCTLELGCFVAGIMLGRSGI